MVIHERLIKFPVPDWNRVISSDLDSIAYCLCYQHDFDLNDFGPYGFGTNNSFKIISSIFPNLFFYKESGNGKSKLISVEVVKGKGIYLYGDIDKINSLNIKLSEYYSLEKKNEIRLKKYLDPEVLPSRPLLLCLEKDCGYKSDGINKIINSGCGLFIYHHYMPEAGDSMILFDRYLESSLKNTVLSYGVQFLEVDSINDLKAW